MSDALQTVTLRCPSCGSYLNVSYDMERLACGHCGTEQVVLRTGGTVSLKPVEEALSKVQVGTDKTAAELSLVRLRGELAELERKWQEEELHFARQRRDKYNPYRVNLTLASAAFVVFVTLFAVGTFTEGKTPGTIFLGVAALVLVWLARWRIYINVRRTLKWLEAEHQAKWQVFYEQTESIKSQIAKQRQIVDA